jgi:hypothetical protein
MGGPLAPIRKMFRKQQGKKATPPLQPPPPRTNLSALQDLVGKLPALPQIERSHAEVGGVVLLALAALFILSMVFRNRKRCAPSSAPSAERVGSADEAARRVQTAWRRRSSISTAAEEEVPPAAVEEPSVEEPVVVVVAAAQEAASEVAAKAVDATEDAATAVADVVKEVTTKAVESLETASAAMAPAFSVGAPQQQEEEQEAPPKNEENREKALKLLEVETAQKATPVAATSTTKTDNYSVTFPSSVDMTFACTYVSGKAVATVDTVSKAGKAEEMGVCAGDIIVGVGGVLSGMSYTDATKALKAEERPIEVHLMHPMEKPARRLSFKRIGSQGAVLKTRLMSIRAKLEGKKKATSVGSA